MNTLENHGWDRAIAKVVDPSRTVARQDGQRSRMAAFTAQADEEAVQNAQRRYAEMPRDEAEAAARFAARQPGQRSRMDSFHAEAEDAVLQIALLAAIRQQARAATLAEVVAEVEALRQSGDTDPAGTYLKNHRM